MHPSKTLFNSFLFLLTISLISCGAREEKGYFGKQTITTTFTVEEVVYLKYSKVKGYIVHNSFRVPIDNGNSGYYYKEYDLERGQKIKTDISIYYYSVPGGYRLSFSDIDVSKYEK